MSQDSIFHLTYRAEQAWQLPYLSALCLIALASYILLRQLSTAEGSDYQPKLAWLRAVIYFCVVSLISFFFGISNAIVDRAVFESAQLADPLWLGSALFCAVFIIIAYGKIWAMGTFIDGRQWHPLSNSIFGIMWGLSQGQLFLCFWALAEFSGLSTLWVALLCGIAISAYNGNWQLRYWDIKVSPPHNYDDWNTRKVLLCHVPNLLLTLPFFAIYGNVQLYILWQTMALTLSAHRMHFPAWSDYYTASPGASRKSKRA